MARDAFEELLENSKLHTEIADDWSHLRKWIASDTDRRNRNWSREDWKQEIKDDGRR